jgi:PAS domain S-box-containing protein
MAGQPVGEGFGANSLGNCPQMYEHGFESGTDCKKRQFKLRFTLTMNAFLHDVALQASLVGVATCAIASACMFYMWNANRSERYLSLWGAAWLIAVLRWLVHYPAESQPSLRLLEAFVAVVALFVIAVGAYLMLPNQPWHLRPFMRAAGVMAIATFVAGVLAQQELVYAYCLLATFLLFVTWCFWQSYCQTRLSGYAIAAITTTLWLALLIVSTAVLGPDFRNFIALPLFNTIVMTSFLVVANQRARQHGLATERLLRKSEARFAKAFHQSPMASTISRLSDGKLLDVNQATADLLGYRREEGINRVSTEVGAWVDSSDRERFVALLRRDGRVVGLESDARTRSGELITLRRYAELIELDDEQCVLTAVFDVTQENRQTAKILELTNTLEQKVLDRTAELADAVRELEDMTATISHDLRAPLRHISGFSTQLSMNDDFEANDRVIDLSRRINDAVQRMGELIDKLLENARLGRVAIDYADVSLSKMVESYVHDLSASVGARRIEWTIAPLPNIHADPVMARQVVQNLLENAVKYTSKRAVTKIEIAPIDTAHDRGFFIKDNGAGFNMRQSGQLFGVFKRMHKASEFAGVGVGLANVRRIMQRHRGRVWCEAEVDKGATFFVAFPAMPTVDFPSTPEVH